MNLLIDIKLALSKRGNQLISTSRILLLLWAATISTSVFHNLQDSKPTMPSPKGKMGIESDHSEEISGIPSKYSQQPFLPLSVFPISLTTSLFVTIKIARIILDHKKRAGLIMFARFFSQVQKLLINHVGFLWFAWKIESHVVLNS